MKKIMFIQILLAALSVSCLAQELSPREKAEDLAKNAFSKTKDKIKTKNGQRTEVHVKIEATPVVKDNITDYAGNYWYQDLQYKIEIRFDAGKKPIATLSIPGEQDVQLKNVSISQAYFSATRQKNNGEEEVWEGVFIRRSGNDKTEYGLGIRLANPVPVTEGLQVSNLFFKQASP